MNCIFCGKEGLERVVTSIFVMQKILKYMPEAMAVSCKE
jgi:hypothetical protein